MPYLKAASGSFLQVYSFSVVEFSVGHRPVLRTELCAKRSKPNSLIFGNLRYVGTMAALDLEGSPGRISLVSEGEKLSYPHVKLTSQGVTTVQLLEPKSLTSALLTSSPILCSHLP